MAPTPLSGSGDGSSDQSDTPVRTPDRPVRLLRPTSPAVDYPCQTNATDLTGDRTPSSNLCDRAPSSRPCQFDPSHPPPRPSAPLFKPPELSRKWTRCVSSHPLSPPDEMGLRVMGRCLGRNRAILRARTPRGGKNQTRVPLSHRADAYAGKVAVLALRELRPRRAGGTKPRIPPARATPLRRCPRRDGSQRDPRIKAAGHRKPRGTKPPAKAWCAPRRETAPNRRPGSGARRGI